MSRLTGKGLAEIRAILHRKVQDIAEAEARNRPRLWAALARLGDPDPATRASAAVEVSDMAASLGIDWRAALPMSWQAEVIMLLADPRLTSAERAELHLIKRWHRPGKGGLAVLKEIRERLASGS